MNDIELKVIEKGDRDGLVRHEVTITKGLDKVKNDSDFKQVLAEQKPAGIGRIYSVEIQSKDTWYVYSQK